MGNRKHPSQPSGSSSGDRRAGRGKSPELRQKNNHRVVDGRRLPASDYALPGERYPIDTPNRARDALARAKANATPAEQAKIKAAVERKYPEMKVKANSPDDNPRHPLRNEPPRSKAPGRPARDMTADMDRHRMMDADGQFDSMGRDDV